MKRQRLCVAILSITVLIVGVGPGYGQSPPPRFATSLSPDTTAWQALMFWQEELARMSRKEFMVQIFPESQLGTHMDMLYGVRFGHIEMALLPVDVFFSLSPSLKAIAVPYIFRNTEHRLTVLDGPIGRGLLRALSRYHSRGLGFFEAEPQGIFSFQEPLRSPDSFAHVAIGYAVKQCESEDPDRQPEREGGLSGISLLEVLEARCVPLCPEKQQDMLASGDLAAWKGPLTDWPRLRTNSITVSGVTVFPYLEQPYVLIANKAWFETLPPEEQNMLLRATQLAVVYQRQLLTAATEEQINLLEEAGAAIESIDWQQMYEAIWPSYARLMAESQSDVARTLQAIEQVK